MRGKVGDHAVIGVHHRSTPAHAGKSHCSRRRATALRDHPRACGEKPRVSSPIGRQMGSPPRMRGKGEVEAGKESVDRITPAYAGKRGRCPRPAGRRWDHPRVCGEKIRARLHPRFLVGSPPRMRGKDWFAYHSVSRDGITPAYAGKRPTAPRWVTLFRDHPRVCGEKLLCICPLFCVWGSPPRMRGKALSPEMLHLPSGDHPRVCGEKDAILICLTGEMGSPPRMRGKANSTDVTALVKGITPAYAGKSGGFVYDLAAYKDHPRVCGEKAEPLALSGPPSGSPPRMRGKAGLG